MMSTKKATTVCLGPISALGHGKLQGPTENSAKLNWQNTAPANFNSWSNAINKDVSCHHDGRPPWLRQWTCTATAEPCNGSGGTSSGGTGGAPLCYDSFNVEGNDAKLQTGAENNAVYSWQQTASNNHGPAYAGWGLARGKDISCHHNGLGPLQRRWRCVATGTPCRQP
jgi:hypothetical protein